MNIFVAAGNIWTPGVMTGPELLNAQNSLAPIWIFLQEILFKKK